MMKGDHGPRKLLHAPTWDAFDYASHAPQVRACNYYIDITYIQLYMYMYMSTWLELGAHACTLV